MMSIRRRYIYAGLGFFLFFILQTTITRHIVIFDQSPNLILCLVVVCGFLYEEKIGLFYGVLFGLLLDFTGNVYIGPSAVGFILVYLFVLFIRKIFHHERLLPELLLIGVATPLHMVTLHIFNLIAGNPVSVMTILKELPVAIVYNGIIVVLLHLFLTECIRKGRSDLNYKENFSYRGNLKI